MNALTTHLRCTRLCMAEHGDLHSDSVAHYALGRKACKGEDKHLAITSSDYSGYSLLAVFDGHGGRAAAEACVKQLPSALSQALAAHLAAEGGEGPQSQLSLARALPAALVDAFRATDEYVCASCSSSGCTATVAVVLGRLVTVAAVGDSLACLDTLNAVHKLSAEHRVASHAGERARILAAGGSVAPASDEGTLRVWPGGLAVSRAMGDATAKPAGVCALPEVSQCLIPAGTGARLVLASDGLWDSVPSHKAALSSVRKLAPASAVANALVRQAVTAKGAKDDCTVIVVDFLASRSDRGPFQSLGAGHGAQEAAAHVHVKWPITGVAERPLSGYMPPAEPRMNEHAPAAPAATAPVALGRYTDELERAVEVEQKEEWQPVPSKRKAINHGRGQSSGDGNTEQHQQSAAPVATPPVVIVTATAPPVAAVPMETDSVVAAAQQAAALALGAVRHAPSKAAPLQSRPPRKVLPKPWPLPAVPAASALVAPDIEHAPPAKESSRQQHPRQQQQQRQRQQRQQTTRRGTQAPRSQAQEGMIPTTPAQMVPPALVLPPPRPPGPPYTGPVQFGTFPAPPPMDTPRVFHLDEVERALTATQRAQWQ